MELVKHEPAVDILLNETVKGPELTEQEKQIVATLFSRTNEDVAAYIPENIDQETLHSWLESSAKVRAKLDWAQRKIKPIMGRMFVLVKKRKDLLDYFGCKNFTHFMDIYVPKNFFMSPQEAWSAHWTVEEFPDISCDEYESVGIAKLKVIAAAVPRDKSADDIDPSIIRQRKELIEEAKNHRKSTSLADKIEELGIAKRNQVLKDKVIIYCDLQMVEAFEAMCSDPRVIAYAGSDHPTAIFAAMMQEFHGAAMSEAAVARE